jgi:tetratricopeptide (TPR) repeat protein
LQEHRNLTAIYKKGAYRIMCLGESTTAIGGNDSYPSQLEEILNQRHIGITFSVINKGVVAINSITILSQLEDNLDRYRPDLVTAMMGDNDRYVKYYEDIPETNTFLFNSFRTYRLARLLWMHIINKIKKKGQLEYSLLGLKECYAQQLNPRQIEASLKKTAESQPKSDKAYFELGRFYSQQRNFSKAEEALNKAIELNSGNELAYLELSGVYLVQGKFSSCGEILKKVIEINPKNDSAYLQLGKNYIFMKKYNQCEEPLKKATVLNPKNHMAYFELGKLYMYKGDLIEAEKMFKKTIELNPETEACHNLILLYEMKGESKAAQKYSAILNKLKPEQCNPITASNYLKLKGILDKRGIKLVCIQYPMRSIEPLKRIFQGQDGVIFVDNERIFKDAVKKEGYRQYFTDMFGGDFGHCTPKGNRLLAENIANAILKRCFNNKK